MGDGGVQRVCRLPGQHGAHGLDGARHHHGNPAAEFLAQAADAEQGGLDVARILAGLHQQHVGAAVHHGLGLLVEVLDEFRECHAARDRDRFGGGPNGAGHEARAAGGGELVGGLARDTGGGEVQLIGAILQAVLGQHQAGAAEGVGLHHVGAGLVISAVNVEDDIRARDDEVFVAAFQGRPAEVVRCEMALLHHGAHGSIEDEDTGLKGVV